MKPKHLPRLWCALQGLLPFEACISAQRGELALPDEDNEASAAAPTRGNPGGDVHDYCVAEGLPAQDVGGRVSF